jgi:hypothetical protein
MTVFNQIELVEGHQDLQYGIGGAYEFICDSGILYGRNLSTMSRIPLAVRKGGLTRKFTPENGIKGYSFITYICNNFNLKGISADKADAAIVEFANQLKENLDHGSSFGNI